MPASLLGDAKLLATEMVTNSIRHAGLRPEPFYLGVAYAGLGLGLSALFVRETRGHAHHEAGAGVFDSAALSTREVFVRTSFR